MLELQSSTGKKHVKRCTDMQLVSTNIGGNLHQAVGYINKMGLADFVFALDSTGHNTVAVFRVPDDLAPKLRRYLGQTVDTENFRSERAFLED